FAVTAASGLFFFFLVRPPQTPTLFPYTTLFRSSETAALHRRGSFHVGCASSTNPDRPAAARFRHHLIGMNELRAKVAEAARQERSEEHTSELQSRSDLVCRLLLEKKNRPTGPPA